MNDAWYNVAGYAREPSEQRTMQRAAEICDAALGAKLAADQVIALAQTAFAKAC